MPLRSSSSATTGSSEDGGASGTTRSAVAPGADYRAVKEDRARTARAHAALVFDEDGIAQGWCQDGSPGELPGIKHRREYDKTAPPCPDRRITCLYTDRKHQGQGIARAALAAAVDRIAQTGGGLVEAIPEQYGFTRGRQLGRHAWIVSRVVDPA